MPFPFGYDFFYDPFNVSGQLGNLIQLIYQASFSGDSDKSFLITLPTLLRQNNPVISSLFFALDKLALVDQMFTNNTLFISLY